jgi:hypothetical protein
MPDGFLTTSGSTMAHPDLPDALEQAAGAIARLDQALDGHPLLSAFLYRARLDAVRRQAAVDGHGIDPWHLAAVLEGLRLRMEGALRIIDRGMIFEAARTALTHHQWLVDPDFDQEGNIQAAEHHLAKNTSPGALLTAAFQVRDWLETGGTRPPMRAALIRFWRRRSILRHAVPLTGPRALSAGAPDGLPEWVCAFLYALAEEARDYHDLLRGLERSWLAARRKGAGQRSTSRAALAIDVLAAAPLLSATTLARATGLSIKSATVMLCGLVADEVAVEVTHRSARRLFGLAGMAPIRDVTIPPRRPEPGRARGRPSFAREEPVNAGPPVQSAPTARLEWPAIDYGGLDEAIAQAEQVIRSTRHSLDRLRLGEPALLDAAPLRASAIDLGPSTADVE